MPGSVVLIELGAVIVGLAVVARVSSRLGFSPIPLYLLAGLGFGEGGLLPLVTTDEFIEIGAEIGVIMLLFMLGLEYSAEELTETLRTGTRPALLDLVANFAPGLAAGLLLGWRPVAAVLLGGITYISSSGIVAKLSSDFGWVGNREMPTVLSILVLEDLVMALYLPVVAVLLLGVGVVSGIVTVAGALLTVVVILVLGIRFGDHLSSALFSRSDEALLLSIFGITVLVAGITDRLQISAAVGAFLVGIAVSGAAADRARALLTPLRDLFGAVFFVFFGLQIDPSSILPVLGGATALAALGVTTKVGTGWLAAGMAGVGRRGRLRAGTLLVSRGEFSVAIAALGASAGIEPRLAPLTAAYVLVLAVSGPLLARLAGRRRSLRPDLGGGRMSPPRLEEP